MKASKSSDGRMTYSQFLERFPSNDACMDYLRDRFYPAGSKCPKCRKATKFHRVKERSAYACQYCRHQVYPTAGTIFNKSTTSLQLWFWGIFLMSSTRCGISAKQLEREIGVSYPTALRMFRQIRSLLKDEGEAISGEVEVDETAIGGRPRLSDQIHNQQDAMNWAKKNKSTVFAMVERQGRVRARVVPDRTRGSLEPLMKAYILPESVVFSDDAMVYVEPGRHYAGHNRINHSAKVYVDGNVHTQTVEGFFSLLKNGIRGVYHSVSDRYLQDYVDEYAWRYNHREDARPMFWTFLDQVRKSDGPAS